MNFKTEHCLKKLFVKTASSYSISNTNNKRYLSSGGFFQYHSSVLLFTIHVIKHNPLSTISNKHWCNIAKCLQPTSKRGLLYQLNVVWKDDVQLNPRKTPDYPGDWRRHLCLYLQREMGSITRQPRKLINDPISAFLFKLPTIYYCCGQGNSWPPMLQENYYLAFYVEHLEYFGGEYLRGRQKIGNCQTFKTCESKNVSKI